MQSEPVLLNDQEAYAAMIAFLEMHFASTGSDDIGALLSEAGIAGHRATADQANWNRWQECVSRVIANRRSSDSA